MYTAISSKFNIKCMSSSYHWQSVTGGVQDGGFLGAPGPLLFQGAPIIGIILSKNIFLIHIYKYRGTYSKILASHYTTCTHTNIDTHTGVTDAHT